MNKDIYTSIVIPCFNEAEGLSYLASKLRELEENIIEHHELIFVDDGSSDATYDELTRLYEDRLSKDVKIIRHSENKGVGAAVKTGISNARGYYVAVIDSDCTYEPLYLLEMLEIIKMKNADVVSASPYHPRGSIENVPLYRLFLSRNLSNLYNAILRDNIYTYTSMFRVYRGEAIKKIDIKSNSALAMTEILIKAHGKGFRIIEYPATLAGRKFGTSKIRVLKLIKDHLCFIAKVLLKRRTRNEITR